ncbi:MAG: hypothetical protein ACK55Z_03685, partial [bacterium]
MRFGAPAPLPFTTRPPPAPSRPLLFALVDAPVVTPALPLLLPLPLFAAPCGDDETAAATAHRSNYLKYLYAYECWRLHGEQLTR